MGESVGEGTMFDVTCPHCNKPFSAELIDGDAARYQGFKCPHCKLFVPLARVEARHSAADGEGEPEAPPR